MRHIKIHGLDTRRRLMLAGYGLSLLVVTLIVAIASLTWLSSKQADRLAVIANFLTLGTLALALIAGLVALQAYAAATGLPDLELKLSFPFSHPNQPAFTLPKAEHGAVVSLVRNQSLVRVFIRNESAYPARNPAVIIRINGMAIGPTSYSPNKDWTAIEYFSTLGITALQWDGGSTYSIHGHSTRRLPDLNMQGLTYGVANASFTVELLSDGYRREVNIPVKFVAPGIPVESTETTEWI